MWLEVNKRKLQLRLSPPQRTAHTHATTLTYRVLVTDEIDAEGVALLAAEPQIAVDRDTVSRPMTRGLRTINIMTAISGAANTPLTTAAQYRARTGSRPMKLSAAPSIVATAIVA